VDHQLIDPSQTTWEKFRNIIRSQQVRDRDALLEMIDGLTKEMRPETAWLRRRVRGPMP
jgi:hypothetical protein